jgi:hypothetical protein
MMRWQFRVTSCLDFCSIDGSCREIQHHLFKTSFVHLVVYAHLDDSNVQCFEEVIEFTVSGFGLFHCSKQISFLLRPIWFVGLFDDERFHPEEVIGLFG